MNSFRAAILFWTVAAWATSGKPLGETDEVGFQKCKDALKLPVPEVLPGGGWDNLRNVDMGWVMGLTYTNCRTTEDGQYIIPDEIFTIPQKQNLSLYSKVNAKFSAEFQRMKTLQVKDKAIATRVQVRNLIYTVKINPALELSSGFRKELLDISDRLENNQTRMATYLAELLVLNYGTHVITSVDAGAALTQEDHIRASFLQDSQSSHSAVTASAGLAFQNTMNFKFEENYTSQNVLTKSYLSNRTNSRVQSIGGVPFYPGITLQSWQQGITNHLVAIDRSGLPLHFFINPNMLPDLPGPLVKKVSKTVEIAVKRYYTFNTYPGCTDLNSPNFNFQANRDDGSCEGKMTDFSFSGVYQKCSQFSGNKNVVLCPKLEQKNPLTGDFSCPSGYSLVHLLSETREVGYNHLECHKKCTLLVFCKTACEDVFQVANAEFRAFWCVASSQVPDNSGQLFGGLFSSKSINPMTNAQSCPTGYFLLRLFENLKVWVSQDYELGSRSSVPFGGFFSSISKDLGAPSLKKCLRGCSQHLALISDGRQVSYCVKAGLFIEKFLPPASLSPFTQPPLRSEADTNTVIVTCSENARSWIKDSQTHQRRLGEPLELLSGGATAGIVVGATTILAVVITLAIYGTWKFKKRGYWAFWKRQSLVPGTAATGDTPDQEQGQSPA
uniref:MACPF domain-containing protein n=1 Tax=Nomascus leucogenys TaxID=61853 RepID=A0A2I3G8E3_NOMLE